MPSKLDLDNPYIADTAMNIATNYPGEYNINQVCAIYDTMARGGWHYYDEANDRDYLQNANLTLQRGKMSNTIGRGDCDDFAILMASLIESLGGSTRITLAYDKQNKNDRHKSGHAYSELYLGVKHDPRVNEIINWIKSEYNLSIIPGLNYTGEEVWLNLDWGTNHPGGPYFGNNSTMVKRVVIRECPYKISPRIIPVIDSMNSVEGWKIIKDDYGSAINISSEPGIKDMAINISYDLTEGGWVGISKELDPNLLPRASGLNFSCFGLGNQNTIELRMISENGATFNISWARLKANEIWSYHRALYDNLKCSDLEKQCNFDPNKIKKIEFIISNQAGVEDTPGQGSLMLDNVHEIMAIPIGSPWERAEKKRKEALALQLASQAEMDLVKSTDPSLGVILAIESLRTHETAEGGQALLHGLKLLPRPVFSINNNGTVLASAFSPDGSLLATANWDNTSKIWNASTGRLVRSLEHKGPINAVVFSRDGSLLATASDDNTSKIWNTSTGSEIWSLEHNGPVNAVVFSSDGSRLATASA